MNLSVLFEDDDLLVIDKPSGVVVNRAQSIKEPTIQDWMDATYHIQQISSIAIDQAIIDEFKSRSGVVHRLDKETSGVLLLSKNPSSFSALKAQFKDRTVKKSYSALVHGEVVPKDGEVNAPVGRLPWNRMRFGVFPDGREAHTRYHVDCHYTDDKKNAYSLLTAYPTTGRTHQIRVHLQYIRHPIVSDLLYGGRKQARDDRVWCRRLFLHAQTLQFMQPMTGKKITITSPLPEHLSQILSSFKRSH